MNPVLKKIFLTKNVEDEFNKSYLLHSHTSEEQGLFLQSILRKIKPKTSLEIGLAYGISSLFILEVVSELQNENASHIILDPYPDVYWNNIGSLNIKRAGFSQLIDFRKVFSNDGLIHLINEKKRIQFVYIDSTKVFDLLLVDFILINKILDIGGVVVFDDCGFPGIRKLVRLISKFPSYTIFDAFGKDVESYKKSFIKKIASTTFQHFPFKNKLFSGVDFKTDKESKIDYHCIAFQKISEDERNWDWYVDF